MDLRQIRAIYLAYAQIKLSMEDWHAVRDIAAELEILDARIAYQPSNPSERPAGNDPAPTAP